MKTSELSKSLDFLIFIGIIIAIIISAKTIHNYSILNTPYLKKLKINWENGPIMDIKESINDSCPLGYSPFLDDLFEGTIEGCICGNSTITVGKCSSSKCLSIPPTNSSRIYKWLGKNLCVLRVNQNYYSQIKARLYNTCPPETTECGNLDSLGNRLCIDPKKSNCPLNDIKIVNVNENVNPIYTSIQLDDDKKLIFTNKKVNGPILVELKVSEDTPCVDPIYNNLNRSVYVLDSFFKLTKCPNSYRDGRYIKLDSERLEKLMIQNNIYNSVKSLPKYPIDELNGETNLYFRSYVGVSLNCTENFTRSSMNSTDSFVSIINHSNLFNKIVKLVSFFNILIWTFIMIIYISMKYYYILYKNKDNSIQLFMQLITTMWIFIILSLNLFVFVYGGLLRNNYSSIYPGVECGDAYNVRMIGKDQKMINETESSSRIIVIISLISCIIVWIDRIICFQSIIDHEKEN